MQISGRWLAARSEFRETKRAAEVEKARNQHEMNLASAIQDSHRRRTALSTNSLKVDFFMLKHATVGGDWCAADSRRDGSLLVLMIDAAGKGMQAALVVHAVQSIWTAACHDEFFEAGSWIQRLNNVLVEMGRGSPHAVALGLAKVERDKLTYWCAGLGPIYVRRDLEGGADIRSHTGRGTMLGIQASEEIAIKPIVVDLDTTKPSMVFFGTDGVLVGMRKRDKAIIEQFVDILPEHAEERLRTIPIEDDKALVRITITPTVKPKQLSA
jgi:serine phosphatase RsbU (regulator of sigma subunit)